MMLLFGEAQKNNLFSHDIFARYLISTGAMMDNSPHAKQFQTYLYFMPVHGNKSQHNQRTMLLRQSNLREYNRVNIILIFIKISKKSINFYNSHKNRILFNKLKQYYKIILKD